MRKSLFTFILLFSFSAVFGYGFNITVETKGEKYDSLFIQQFTSENSWENIYATPFSEVTKLKNPASLPTGLYLLTGDGKQLAYFIISDLKNQKFKVMIDHGEISYQDSPENSANIVYLRQMDAYEQKMMSIDQTFKMYQQQNLPKEDLQKIVDSLIIQLESIAQEKREYSRQVIAENQGTLLASIIQASIEMKNPPADYFADPELMQQYYMNHFFEDFPWDDARILTTPIAYNKFWHFAMLLEQMKPAIADTFLIRTLNSVQKYPESYFFLFDFIQKIIGSQSSLYWNEALYISMLKNALAYQKTDDTRKVRCERELARLDRNNENTQVPDFQILLSTGEKTNLYNIEAEYLLLDLQNPDCPTCKETMDRLKELPGLNKAIEQNKVKVLTIYFEQNERLWRNYLSQYANPDYLHGWDYLNEIEKKDLYDTNIIPFMYLLDKDKKVIKKDIYWNEIEHYLQQLKVID